MIVFVRGLLEKMPLSSLTQRRVREKYRETYNKTSLDAEQCQLLRNVVLEVSSLPFYTMLVTDYFRSHHRN